MAVPEQTDANEDRLAQTIVEAMGIGDLTEWVYTDLRQGYTRHPQCFEADWEQFMEEEEA